jgi:hypothetical protein
LQESGAEKDMSINKEKLIIEYDIGDQKCAEEVNIEIIKIDSCVPDCSTCDIGTCPGNTCTDPVCGTICQGKKQCAGFCTNILTGVNPFYECDNGGLKSYYKYCYPVCNKSDNTCGCVYEGKCGIESEFCGDDKCDIDDEACQFCDGSKIRVKHIGQESSCSEAYGNCFSNEVTCQFQEDPVINCPVGYTCKMKGECRAECVPKSSKWTEV